MEARAVLKERGVGAGDRHELGARNRGGHFLEVSGWKQAIRRGAPDQRRRLNFREPMLGVVRRAGTRGAREVTRCTRSAEHGGKHHEDEAPAQAPA